jgi:hypothetical protein
MGACTSPAGAPDKTTLTRHSSSTLSGKTLEAYDLFTTRNKAFGAFYITKSGKQGWGAMDKTTTLADAKTVAEAYCQEHNKGNSCTLFATIAPAAGLDKSEVSQNMSRLIRQVQDETSAGNWGAIYATKSGGSGWASNYKSKQDAENYARQRCEEFASNSLNDATTVEVKVHEKVGLYKCELFGFYR